MLFLMCLKNTWPKGFTLHTFEEAHKFSHSPLAWSVQFSIDNPRSNRVQPKHPKGIYNQAISWQIPPDLDSQSVVTLSNYWCLLCNWAFPPLVLLHLCGIYRSVYFSANRLQDSMYVHVKSESTAVSMYVQKRVGTFYPSFIICNVYLCTLCTVL